MALAPRTRREADHMRSDRLAGRCSRCWSAALAVAACGDDDNDSSDSGSASTSERRLRQRRSRRTPATRARRSRSARRTSPSRRCSGRSTRRRSQAAGYTVKKQLNLGDEKIAFKALEGGDDRRATRSTPARRSRRSSASRPTSVPKDPRQAYERGEGGLREEEPHRAAAHAVHELQRGRHDQGDGRRATACKKISDLKGKSPGPDALRLAPSAASAWTACSASSRSTA